MLKNLINLASTRRVGEFDADVCPDSALRLFSLACVAFCCVVIGVAFFAKWGEYLSLNFPVAYGEGPIVRDAWRLLQGQSLYRPLGALPPYAITNYTPVYYLNLSGLFSCTGLSYIPGRCLSLCAGIGVLWLVQGIVYRRTADRLSAVLSSLLLAVTPFSGNLIVNRVDALAAFFSVSSLSAVLALKSGKSSAVVGGIFAGIAALTRQTSFLFPLIVAVGLYARKREFRELVVYLLSFACLAGGASLFLEFSTDGAYSFNVFTANINTVEWDRLIPAIGSIGTSLAIPLVVVVGIIFRRLDVPSNRPILGLLLVGAIPTFLAIAKSGSNLNYLTEMYIALSLIIGLVLGDLYRKQLRWLLVVGLSITTVIISSPNLQIIAQRKYSVEPSKQRIETLLHSLRALTGPILTDDFLGVELLVGKEIIVQPYELNQLQRVGRWRDDRLVQWIRQRDFSAIFISNPFGNRYIRKERWNTRQWRMIRRWYERRGLWGGSSIYLPR